MKFKIGALIEPIFLCYSAYVLSKPFDKGLVDPMSIHIYNYEQS